MKPCSPPQEAFAQHVAGGLTQAEAYRQAYPRAQKWKPEAVHQQASRLASLPHVSARVAELRAAAVERSTLDQARVLSEIAMLAHSDIAGIMHVDGPKAGQVKLPHELDAATRAAVASFKIDEFGRIEYKFWDKNSALERASKVLGLFEKDNRQKADPLVTLLQGLSGNVVGPVADAPPGGAGGKGAA